MDEKKAKELTDSIFNKLNDQERVYLAWIHNQKNKEIEKLNNIINELNNAYCKVITKCEEMIDNRFYINDNAIKKYADEIKDICKYYVGEAKELKGSEK